MPRSEAMANNGLIHARTDDWYRQRLSSPKGAPRIVIDTDAANEIDDQFALAWALLSPQQLQLLAVYATPFSFQYRRQEMVRARQLRRDRAALSAQNAELVRHYEARLAFYERKGWDIECVDWPVFAPPDVGMARSHREILTVFDKLRCDGEGRVFRGSAGYLAAADQPLRSEAADHLIATARAAAPDDPLYVVAMGCVTNVASALLLAPDIVERIVVVWTSGYPSSAPHVNHAFNLEQDLPATQVLLDSGVPLVYLPGFHVGAQLRLSLPEVERFVQGRGAIGDYLHHLFTHNPLWDLAGVESLYAHSWVIWDVITLAWLMRPEWVPSELVRTPTIGADRVWRQAPRRPLMREAYAVARDAIFADFFRKLERAPA
ncbi:MAG TPA: nucleoside hydrolase [Burkholderiaceae bacterium]|nr:nucleoside hydrolase [Burkholderiaceae bacterium]